MYKNLIAEKAIHRLTNQQMANIIGVSRLTYEKRMRTGKFTAGDCKKLCEYFGKDFETLFAIF